MEPAVEDLREPRLHWQLAPPPAPEYLAAAAATAAAAASHTPNDDGEWAYEERREHGREQMPTPYDDLLFVVISFISLVSVCFSV